MKTIAPALLVALAFPAGAQTQGFTSLIRQTQLGSGVQRDMPGALTGNDKAASLPVDSGGSRFDLHAVRQSCGGEQGGEGAGNGLFHDQGGYADPSFGGYLAGGRHLALAGDCGESLSFTRSRVVSAGRGS